jgi:phosphoglycerate-specific signal transduction histidine kinase
MSSTLHPMEALTNRLPLSTAGRRVAALLLLLLICWLDYLTGPRIAFAPFYILPLLGLAFFETWLVSLLFSALAALLFLAAQILTEPETAHLIYPYWTACARFFSFALISVTTSQLVTERRHLLLFETALQEKTRELVEKNRRLEETLVEIRRLQADLVARERQAAVGEAIYVATYEMERPLASIAVYVEEISRLARHPRAQEDTQLILDEMRPLLEKLEERSRDMENILKSTRSLRGEESRTPPEASVRRELGE